MFRFIEMIAGEAEVAGSQFTGGFELSHMYTIWGQEPQYEETLAHLAGYGNSKPVRIGNGANKQFQLDTYGSLLDAYYFMSKRGVKASARSREIILFLAKRIKKVWMEKENGIWEVRGGTRHFTYGKVMAWVGIDRFLAMAGDLKIPAGERKQYEQLKKKIEAWIWANCF